MALEALKMQCVSQAVNRVWLYHSTDDVSAANYFDPMAKQLNVSDVIIQNDETNVRTLTVLTNDGTTVTVGKSPATP